MKTLSIKKFNNLQKGILLLFSLLFLTKIYSQTQVKMCGEINNTVNYRMPNNMDIAQLTSQYTIDDTYCINVFYHIVRDDNGYTSFRVSDLDMTTIKLNEVYSKYKIYINKIGYDFIDNSSFYDVEKTHNPDDVDDFDRLTDTNVHQDAIDIYIVHQITEEGDSYYGLADGTPSKAFVLSNIYYSNHISGHELGHCLGLMHTHDTRHGAELVIRGTDGNCNVAGDLLCDTPADPCLVLENGRYLVDTRCNYIGTATDTNGDHYRPDTHNMMSYTVPVCLSTFTLQQVAIMKANIDGTLSNIQSNSCVSVAFTDNLACENDNLLVDIHGAQSPIRWETSNNLSYNIISNTEISVRANNNNDNGLGYIKVYFGLGKFYKKNVWVGKPDYEIVRNLYAPYDDRGSEVDIKAETTFTKQSVSNISWQQVAGNGYLVVDPDNMGAQGDGNGTGWWVRANVSVENRCGNKNDTAILFDHSIDCDNNPNSLYLFSLPNKKYQIINPCHPNNLQTVTKAELYDIYGVKISDINHQNDKVILDNNTNGQIYIIKADTQNNRASKTIQH